jgi:phospholipase/carboxylesterase
LESETVEGKSLPYVLMKPDRFQPGAGYPLVIVLHGRGASMFDLAGLANAIDADGYVYAFPNAPYRLPIAPGYVGYSWRIQTGVEPPPEGAPPVEELLDEFVADVSEKVGVEPGNVVLGGFSQGGAMTLTYGLPRPETFKGLAVLSGLLRDPDDLKRSLPAERKQPAFVSHGRYDTVIDIETGRSIKAFLEEAGYAPQYKEYDMGHEIPAPVVRDLTPWLHETLPPKGA